MAHPSSGGSPPVVLTIAGSDSGGGAGIQADLKTFAAFGCHGVSAITALTAQNTQRVTAISMVSVQMLHQQIDALFEDFDIRAVKTGMVGDAPMIRAVASALRRHRPTHIVVDPVMVATSGAHLLNPEAVGCLRTELLPLATLLTPNIPEAELLLGKPGAGADLEATASALGQFGSGAVLLKGGHATGPGPVVDLLASAAGVVRFEHARLPLIAHGTGCTLAAACAAGLAQGEDLPTAVSEAIEFVHAALLHAFRPGRTGLAVLNHFAVRRAIP